MILCWSVKGGSGTTVVAAALATLLARRAAAWFVDLAGDGPAVFGMAPGVDSTGVHEWMTSAVATGESFERLGLAVVDGLQMVPRGGALVQERWSELADVLAQRRCVVDAGLGSPPAVLAAAADQSLLVTRACFLALRRAVTTAVRPTGVVLVAEPGRALTAADVEAVVGAPVVARVSIDPSVARVVDSGTLGLRLPRGLARQLHALT
ncbi:MAG: cellulose synthase operon protein YhjQ/BcsQ [Ilumatobacteraceae bacterium]